MRLGIRAKILAVVSLFVILALVLSSFAVYLSRLDQAQAETIESAFEVALDADLLTEVVQRSVAEVTSLLLASDGDAARTNSSALQGELKEIDTRRSALLAKIGDQMSPFEKSQLSLRIDEFISYQEDTARLCLQVSPKAAIIQANDEATVANRTRMLADVQAMSRRMIASVEVTRKAAGASRTVRTAMLQVVPALAIAIGGLLVVALLRTRDAKLQKKRYDVAMNNMPQGICMTDKSRVLSVINRSLAIMFDVREDISGCSVRQLAERIVAATGLPAQDESAFIASFEALLDASRHSHLVATLGDRIFEFRCNPMDDGGFLLVIDDVTAAQIASRQIEQLAMFDSLTDLPNRTQFQDMLATRISQYGEHRSKFFVLCLDLDAFKQVNDTLGHPMGDKLLREVAKRLTANVRVEDIVARFGGDEFVIILGPSSDAIDLDAIDLDAMCGRLIAAASAPYEIEGHTLAISASIGTSAFPRDAVSVETLVKTADLALYHAKALGRKCFTHFDPRMQEEAMRKREIENDLREALAKGELEVFYQPVVDVRTHRAIAFEALLRWRHPQRGLVSPSVFIPIAEETGMIVEIGEWTLNQACRDAGTWPEDVRVAVNFSPLQFQRCDIVATISRALASSGLAARRLEVEVTETILVQDAATTLATFDALAQLGVRLSLDDFGTGYSSLSYLNRFPFHKIKIDRSFVKDLHNPRSLAVITAVMHLAQELNLSVVAEGVETIDQLDVLSSRGVREIQGFLYSPPGPLAEIAHMARGRLDARLEVAA